MYLMKNALRKLTGGLDDQLLDRLADDEGYAAASAVLGQLTAALAHSEAQLQRIEIRRAVAQGMRLGQQGERHRDLKRRLAELDNQLAIEAADLPSAIALGLKIVDNEPIPEPQTEAEQVDQFERHIRIIRQAIDEQAAVVAAIAADLSAAYARREQPRHTECLVRVYRAAQDLSRALDSERLFRLDLVQAGFSWIPETMPAPNLPGASRLGAESDAHGELSAWRRFLEGRGII
jgi:hypothetical protein